MKFEWDPAKAEANLKKHGVTFEEGTTAFDDVLRIEFFDPDHSESENRFLVIGQSVEQRLVIVSFTERENRVRIISVRLVTRKEKRDYENGRFE